MEGGGCRRGGLLHRLPPHILATVVSKGKVLLASRVQQVNVGVWVGKTIRNCSTH